MTAARSAPLQEPCVEVCMPGFQPGTHPTPGTRVWYKVRAVHATQNSQNCSSQGTKGAVLQMRASVFFNGENLHISDQKNGIQPCYNLRLEIPPNSLGIDIALDFMASNSMDSLGLLLPIAICVNLWMLGFDVQCSLLHRWSFVVLCCLL